MRITPIICASMLIAASAVAAMIPGDSERGAELFRSQKCVTCHSINGEGGDTAPDLARRPAGRYTPSLLAATMWNHAPAMWEAMEQANIERPQLTVEQAADLFAFFYAHRYGERPGDAGRGKQVFTEKGCARCHLDGDAPALSEWTAAHNAVELARSMWNHAPMMQAALGDQPWPRLTPQQMTDLVVYARNVPGARQTEPVFDPASAETGRTLFEAKGCNGCHTGDQALAGRLQGRSLAGLAAAMWNHAPEMRDSAQELRPEEMSRLVGYLWSIQYFDYPGDKSSGRQIAVKKGCVSCHESGRSAPDFKNLGPELDAIRFASAIWQHGPAMLREIQRQNKRWPRFENWELNDLLAYVNSL